MKILILANNDVGLFKFRRELIQELLKNHEVTISLPYGKMIEPLIEDGCHFVDTTINRRGSNPIEDIGLFLHYCRILNRIKPDIVFTYTIKPNVYGGMACSLLGIPYIVNITGLGTAVENGGILQIITLILYKAGIRKARKVFCQNTDNLNFMLAHKIIQGDYDLLPGSGVNLNQFKLLPYPNNDTIDFVFISRIMKEKGIDQYLEAARVIRTKYPETRFHICGFCEQDYDSELNLLNNDGTVIYHGLVDDMLPIYQMASCIVHPSYYPEGLSNVLLEGAATGRPIITTDRPGCREVVEDGINGFIVEEQNSEDLIEKIELFLHLDNEKRQKMGKAGRDIVENAFDRDIVIQKYFNELSVIESNS